LQQDTGMTSVAELEISVRRADIVDTQDISYVIDLRFTPTPGGAWTQLITGKPPTVSIDTDGLRQETLDPDAYGRRLTGMLFADQRLRHAFAQVRASVEGATAVLRLRLRLDTNADELHSIRWELLQDPLATDHAPLAQNERILFSRYLDSA